MNQRGFARWIKRRHWRDARTQLQWPHQYSVVDRRRDSAWTIRQFEAAVLFVRRHGERRRFIPTQSRFDYYDHSDGMTYWTMGWPPHMTILMNRAVTDPQSKLHMPVKRRALKRESGG